MNQLVSFFSTYKRDNIEKVTSTCSTLVLGLFCVAGVLVLYTSYLGWLEKPPIFRVTISALCFFAALATSLLNVRWGVMACMFALPLLPAATTQIQAFTGYGRIFPIHAPGFDVVIGFALGVLGNRFVKGDKYRLFYLPWPLLLLLSSILLSTGLAIARNLHQTQSSFQTSALLHNLLHFRTIGWHDDYRPLFDCIAYIFSISMIGILLPILQQTKDRDALVFRPLVASTVVAALVGVIQSQTARGLTEWQAWYFRHDSLGFIALGSQPDIHAFAGQMMMGAVGLLGWLYATRNKLDRLAILCTIPLAWIALILSKSKSSVVLALMLVLFIAITWWYRQNKKVLYSICVTIFAMFCLLISAYAVRSLVLPKLDDLALGLGLGDLRSLNVKMAYRPEIFHAALHMLARFPLLGLGQGDFYRLSADPAFSQSAFLSTTLNGENAHNYFLQTLAENGVLGFAIFIFAILYPIKKSVTKKVMVPGIIALASIFIGNIYAHSLLVRENFFLAAAFVALLYARQSVPTASPTGLQSSKRPASRNSSIIKLLLISAASLLAFKEAARSFNKPPFTYDAQCLKNRPLAADGWTAGLFEVPLREGSSGVQITLKDIQPGLETKPLEGLFTIVDAQGVAIVSEALFFDTNRPTVIKVKLPNNDIATDDLAYRAVLHLGRCFIPRNFGMNADERRLGVAIDTIRLLPPEF